MINKKAEMGVGTLIVFISMLLVAAVAAGVLITTVGTIQQKALTTGMATTSEISSHIYVMQVAGSDGSDADIEELEILVRLAAGSEPIDLNTTMIEIGQSDNSGTYMNGTGFNVSFYVNGSEHVSDQFMTKGDVVMINVSLPRAAIADENVRVVMIPKVGTQTFTEFRMPESISTQRVYLYP